MNEKDPEYVSKKHYDDYRTSIQAGRIQNNSDAMGQIFGGSRTERPGRIE